MRPMITSRVKRATSVSPTSGSWTAVPGDGNHVTYHADGDATVVVYVGDVEVEYNVPDGVPITIEHGGPGTDAVVTLG